MRKSSCLRIEFQRLFRNVLSLVFAGGFVLCGYAQEARYFRLVSPTITAITRVTTNSLTWTNAATGGICTVQTSGLAVPGTWSDYAQVTVTNRVMTISLSGSAPFAGMVLIPAGSFSMGDTFNEGFDDEKPTHSVYINAFYMDTHEVTKALWDEVKYWSFTNGYSFAGSGKGPNHPVQGITWSDAARWCNARSQKEKLTPCYYTDAGLTNVYKLGLANPYVKWSANGYRLPTEAEWEKAARGGAGGWRFPWNATNTISHGLANYDAAVAQSYDLSFPVGYHPAFASEETPYTSPVGSFAPNSYGLYDMAGNVWEYCWDWYQSNWYAQSGATQTDSHGPTGPLTYRVLRGGSWARDAFFCRTAYREYYYANFGDGDDGFRCVRSY